MRKSRSIFLLVFLLLAGTGTRAHARRTWTPETPAPDPSSTPSPSPGPLLVPLASPGASHVPEPPAPGGLVAPAPPRRHHGRAHRELVESLRELEERTEQLDAELEVLKAETRMVMRRHGIAFSNETYLKLAFAIIFPVKRTFGRESDPNGYGLGLGAAVGHYFGRHHVLEVGTAIDAALFADFRYRYEIHLDRPALTLAPVIGYRRQISATPLPNNFIPDPGAIEKQYLIAGGVAGLALEGTLVETEVALTTNRQSFLFFNTSFHFFL